VLRGGGALRDGGGLLRHRAGHQGEAPEPPGLARRLHFAPPQRRRARGRRLRRRRHRAARHRGRLRHPRRPRPRRAATAAAAGEAEQTGEQESGRGGRRARAAAAGDRGVAVRRGAHGGGRGRARRGVGATGGAGARARGPVPAAGRRRLLLHTPAERDGRGALLRVARRGHRRRGRRVRRFRDEGPSVLSRKYGMAPPINSSLQLRQYRMDGNISCC
jgi:hypothetical protein